MFRWRKEEDGSWVGVDGGNWYRLWHGQPGHASHDLPGRGVLDFDVNREPDGGTRHLPPTGYSHEEEELSVASTRPVPGRGSALQVQSNVSEQEATRFFRLDRDAREVEARVLKLGSELKPAIDQLQGIRLMRPSSLVETVFTFLCTANNNLHRIIPMCWKLGSYGESLGEGLHAFPNTERIAAIPEQELRAAGFGYRGATIPRAAKAILERGGEGWLEELRQAEYPDLHRELCALPGIGPKLADCIALYGYDRGEAVPLDTHIWQAFTRLYHPEWKGKAVTDFRYREATQRFRERFGDLSGWAHLFLFYESLLRGGKRRERF